MLATLPIFPCNLPDKSPLVAGGFKSARRGANAERWPLAGFATGEASGIDVLDIDPSGRDWYDANFDAIPTTRAHTTQRGLHLLFRHARGLRCSKNRIAKGVDVRADGGYAIYWPREGLPIEDHPICDWPGWLLKEAMEPKRVERVVATSKYLNKCNSIHHGGHDGLTEALRKLDPVCWRGQHDEWLMLMTACRCVGIDCEDFVAWSIGDPVYAGDANLIRLKWNSTKPKHGGALFAALKAAGIKLNGREQQHNKPQGWKELVEVHARRKAQRNLQFDAPTLKPRLDGILRWLRHRTTEVDLFSASCLVAEIMAEHNRPKPSDAMKLLKGAAKDNGLWALLGADGVRKTIANGFAHVEEKLLAEKENEHG